MRFLKGLLVWLLGALVILSIFTGLKSALSIDDTEFLIGYQIIVLVVPIVLAVTLSRRKWIYNRVPQWKENGPYQITIVRKVQFGFGGVATQIAIDGFQAGKVRAGGTIAINANEGDHILLFTDWRGKKFFSKVTLSPWHPAVKISVKYDMKGNIIIAEENMQPSSAGADSCGACNVVGKDIPTAEESIKRELSIKDRDPLEIIKMMEDRFSKAYHFAYDHMLNTEDCKRLYSKTVQELSGVEYPLASQIRFEQLCEEYREKFENPNPMVYVDALNGYDFERWCANLLSRIGFEDVTVTPGSGDQGVDILAVKEGIHYAIQCKCYHSDLGNTPVQEVQAGKAMYGCQVAAVMTNRYFTAGVKVLAQANGVLLWDRDMLQKFIMKAEDIEI